MAKVKIVFPEDFKFFPKNLQDAYRIELISIFQKFIYQTIEFPCVPMEGMLVNLESFCAPTPFDLDKQQIFLTGRELECLQEIGDFLIAETIIYSSYIKIYLVYLDPFSIGNEDQ